MIERSSVRSGVPAPAAPPAHGHAPKGPTAGPPPVLWQLTADHLDWPSVRALLGTNRNTRQGMLDAPPAQWRRAARTFVPAAAHKPAAFQDQPTIARTCLRYEIAQRNLKANLPAAVHTETFCDVLTAHAWSPDGVFLALGRRNGTVRVLDATGTAVSETAHECVVTNIAWSPDGRWCASGGMRGTVHILDTHGGETRVTRHEGMLVNLHWSPDSRHLVATNTGRTLPVLNVPEARTVRTIVARDAILAATWSADGSLLTTGCTEGRVRVIRAADGAEVASHRHTVRRVSRRRSDPVHQSAWAPDGSMVVSVGEEGTLSFITPKGDVHLYKADFPEDVRVLWAPDSTRFLFQDVFHQNAWLVTKPTDTQPTRTSARGTHYVSLVMEEVPGCAHWSNDSQLLTDDPEPLTWHANDALSVLDWAPDGTSLMSAPLEVSLGDTVTVKVTRFAPA